MLLTDSCNKDMNTESSSQQRQSDGSALPSQCLDLNIREKNTKHVGNDLRAEERLRSAKVTSNRKTEECSVIKPGIRPSGNGSDCTSTDDSGVCNSVSGESTFHIGVFKHDGPQETYQNNNEQQGKPRKAEISDSDKRVLKIHTSASCNPTKTRILATANSPRNQSNLMTANQVRNADSANTNSTPKATLTVVSVASTISIFHTPRRNSVVNVKSDNGKKSPPVHKSPKPTSHKITPSLQNTPSEPSWPEFKIPWPVNSNSGSQGFGSQPTQATSNKVRKSHSSKPSKVKSRCENCGKRENKINTYLNFHGIDHFYCQSCYEILKSYQTPEVEAVETNENSQDNGKTMQHQWPLSASITSTPFRARSPKSEVNNALPNVSPIPMTRRDVLQGVGNTPGSVPTVTGYQDCESCKGLKSVALFYICGIKHSLCRSCEKYCSWISEGTNPQNQEKKNNQTPARDMSQKRTYAVNGKASEGFLSPITVAGEIGEDRGSQFNGQIPPQQPLNLASQRSSIAFNNAVRPRAPLTPARNHTMQDKNSRYNGTRKNNHHSPTRKDWSSNNTTGEVLIDAPDLQPCDRCKSSATVYSIRNKVIEFFCAECCIFRASKHLRVRSKPPPSQRRSEKLPANGRTAGFAKPSEGKCCQSCGGDKATSWVMVKHYCYPCSLFRIPLQDCVPLEMGLGEWSAYENPNGAAALPPPVPFPGSSLFHNVRPGAFPPIWPPAMQPPYRQLPHRRVVELRNDGPRCVMGVGVRCCFKCGAMMATNEMGRNFCDTCERDVVASKTTHASIKTNKRATKRKTTVERGKKKRRRSQCEKSINQQPTQRKHVRRKSNDNPTSESEGQDGETLHGSNQ